MLLTKSKTKKKATTSNESIRQMNDKIKYEHKINTNDIITMLIYYNIDHMLTEIRL